jgi:hypothetical protein
MLLLKHQALEYVHLYYSQYKRRCVKHSPGLVACSSSSSSSSEGFRPTVALLCYGSGCASNHSFHTPKGAVSKPANPFASCPRIATKSIAFSVWANFQCQLVRKANTREECHWAHACKSFKSAGVGTNSILECKFESKNAHRARHSPNGITEVRVV